MKEAQDFATEEETDVLYAAQSGTEWSYRPVCDVERGVDNRHIVLLGCVEVALSGHRNEDQVVTNAHLLALRALFRGRVDRPPAGLTLRVLLQAYVEGQLVVGRAG